MDNKIQNKLESLGFSEGSVYKYITYYGESKGIIVIGVLEITGDLTASLREPLFIKYDLPKKDASPPREYTVKINDTHNLHKIDASEYILYSLVKKI